jgi:hypothetical protein
MFSNEMEDFVNRHSVTIFFKDRSAFFRVVAAYGIDE